MAGEDREHVRRVKLLSCAVCGKWPTQAHHRHAKGLGIRAHDHETIPLCFNCHGDIHQLRKGFKGMSYIDIRAWEEVEILRTKRRLEEEETPA